MLLNTNDTLEATPMAATNSLQPSIASKGQDVQLKQLSHSEPEKVNDLRMIWKMRWCFFWVGIALSTFWMIAMIAVSLYTLYITGNLLSLLLSAASAPAIEFMRRFANYLLPIDERQFRLAKKKIELRAQKTANDESI